MYRGALMTLLSVVWSGYGSPAVRLYTFPFFSFIFPVPNLLNMTSAALGCWIESLHYCCLYQSYADQLATFFQGQM